MDRIEALQAVLQDENRSQAERDIAARSLHALNASTDVPVALPQMTDATCAMLATLKVERIADLNEDAYERHCVTQCVKPSDPIVREFRRWVPPSEAFLDNIGMTLADWLLAMAEMQPSASSLP
ncbi:MAG: hypothetical protein WBF09_20640 [Candidatus Acidiferrum sp.]